MTSLIAIASKQVQLQEIATCIEHFSVDEIGLYLFNHQGRISVEGVRKTLRETCSRARIKVSTFDIDDQCAIADILNMPADIVAFPLYRASALYRRVPRLRRQSTIVHITDGIGDLFTMWELQSAVLARANLNLLKAALVIPQLYALRADLEFNLFHPEKTPYARKSLPVRPFPIAATKRKALENLLKRLTPEALVIDGFDLTADVIAGGLGLRSYVATRRDGGILIDGRLFLEEEIICAEEVLALTRPNVVAGCPSTSLAATRALYPDLPTFCLTTPEARRIRGHRFNDVFRNHAERLGIQFSKARDIPKQLSDLRQQLPPTLRASA